ncbi:MAG TPA: SufS family cysteine desulfurase [Phycisphaerae bacterium]|nr:SufS family cysteine desulfurase [Phycisphaerae bacterium]
MTAEQKTFDPAAVRRDFPILAARSHGKPLVYLDNGATTQKPRQVIDALVRYYESQNANIHRGVYELSQTATSLYESVREKIRAFINAREPAEIIFTRGTTESINLVAASWSRANLRAGDTVILSHLEHHSNIVPWQMACEATGASLKVIPINDAGELDMDAFRKLLADHKVKMVAVNHVSNSLGTINPVAEITRLAHAAGAKVLIDGAQWVAHGTTDVQALDCDFYAFSGHKMMAPTGIGVLYGRRELLDAMPPYQGGGDMIASVTFNKTEYAALPNKFEAGTPDIAGVAGLGAAVDYLQAIGLDKTAAYEHDLLAFATEKLRAVPGLKIIGNAREKAAVISFVIDGLSTLDIGVALDREGIAVRTGHHCCQPVMERFGIAATARASFAFYNTREDADALASALTAIVRSKTAAPATAKSEGKIEFPAPIAPTVEEAAATLAEEFEFLGDRDAKNEYVLDMAKQLPQLFSVLSKVTERVPGCMSQVYLVGRKKEDSGNNGNATFEFVADADAEIVRGLIALLEKIYSGQKARDVAAFDIESFFHKIGLEQFITSQRRNGLAGMVAKIRGIATEIANAR